MINKFSTAGILCAFTLVLSGCLAESESNIVVDDGGSGTVPPPSGGTPPPVPPPVPPPPAPPPPVPPPSGALDTIPDVPFDYLAEPGAVTASGTFPASMAAGTVYALQDSSVSHQSTFTCNGTEASPVFIIGGRLFATGDIFNIVGSYCYFIDTKFESLQPRPNGDHIVFRNVEVFNNNAKNGMNINGSNVVVVDSEIHHNQRPGTESNRGNDAHGIQVGRGASDIWILNNDLHHNSGNGLQACHECSVNPPSGIYIGGNVFHSDREVGVGLKYADNVIIEGNVFHSYLAAARDAEFCFDDNSSCGWYNSGSDGNSIVVGSDNVVTGLTRVQILNNEIFNTSNAVRIEESADVRIVGNNFHDISGQCLTLDKWGLNTIFSDNTCKNASRGIFQHWRENFSLTVDGNTFENIAAPAIEYESRPVCDGSTLTNNQFIGTGAIVCANTTAASSEQVNALPGASGNTFN